jgi:uridylate kinase
MDHVTWDYFASIVGDKWTPGLNMPFDPIATKKASGLGLKVIILNGKNIPNLQKAMDNQPFVGTMIAPA